MESTENTESQKLIPNYLNKMVEVIETGQDTVKWATVQDEK